MPRTAITKRRTVPAGTPWCYPPPPPLPPPPPPGTTECLIWIKALPPIYLRIGLRACNGSTPHGLPVAYTWHMYPPTPNGPVAPALNCTADGEHVAWNLLPGAKYHLTVDYAWPDGQHCYHSIDFTA
jgi:hypothetical protein